MLLGIYLERPSGAGWEIPMVNGRGAGAGAGAGRTYGAAQERGRSLGRGSHCERVSKILGSGARALRKYACDVIAKRRTVHVSVSDCK
eukprot:6211721-Pleurochrysis_carterae.AAC.1